MGIEYRRRVSELETSSSAVSTTFTKYLARTNHFLQRLSRASEALEVTSSHAERVLDSSRNDSDDAARRFEVKESEFEHKTSVIEGEIERLNGVVREWQSKEASAGAIGRQSHAAVGMFAGAGGSTLASRWRRYVRSMLTSHRPTHHKETLIKLKDEARKTAIEHGNAIEQLKRATAALNKAMDDRRNLTEAAALARKAERMRAETTATRLQTRRISCDILRGR